MDQGSLLFTGDLGDGKRRDGGARRRPCRPLGKVRQDLDGCECLALSSSMPVAPGGPFRGQVRPPDRWFLPHASTLRGGSSGARGATFIPGVPGHGAAEDFQPATSSFSRRGSAFVTRSPGRSSRPVTSSRSLGPSLPTRHPTCVPAAALATTELESASACSPRLSEHDASASFGAAWSATRLSK